MATDKGWEIIEEYVDNDVRGTIPLKDRKHGGQMLRDIEAGRVQAVIVWDLDRLTRDPFDLEGFVKLCERAGMNDLVWVGGSLDAGSGDGLLTARIKGAMAAEELKKIKQRIARKHLELAQAGRWHGGRRPFGYNVNGGELVINEAEADLIREAAQHIRGGGSLASIAKRWNMAGVSPVMGGTWQGSTVRRMLQGSVIAGIRVHHTTVNGVKRVDEYPGQWDAILDMATWKGVCGRFDSRRPNVPREMKRESAYVLRGILRCENHGSKLEGQRRNGARYYQSRKPVGGCGVLIKAENAEAFLLPILTQLADDPRMRLLLMAAQGAEMADAQHLVAENDKDLASIDTLGELVLSGALNPGNVRAARERLEAQIDQRNAQLSQLRGTSALDVLGGQVQESWDGMTDTDKRAVLRSLVSHIGVEHGMRTGRAPASDRLHLHWTVPAWEEVISVLAVADGRGTYRIKLAGAGAIGAQSAPGQ